MEMNRRLGEDIICGPFFLVRDDGEGDFASLSEQQLEQYKEVFGKPEQFAEYEPDAEPHMSRVFQNNTPPQRGNIGYSIDKKLRRRMKEKKIAQGHKADDQEQQQDYIIPY